jgi:hypothetical protein
MGARELLAELQERGMTVVAKGDRLVIRPASKLTDDTRNALRAAKPELLVLLADPLGRALVEAINRCCDVRSDDDANRAALITDALVLPIDMQADLLTHFVIEAARNRRFGGLGAPGATEQIDISRVGRGEPG